MSSIEQDSSNPEDREFPTTQEILDALATIELRSNPEQLDGSPREPKINPADWNALHEPELLAHREQTVDGRGDLMRIADHKYFPSCLTILCDQGQPLLDTARRISKELVAVMRNELQGESNTNLSLGKEVEHWNVSKTIVKILLSIIVLTMGSAIFSLGNKTTDTSKPPWKKPEKIPLRKRLAFHGDHRIVQQAMRERGVSLDGNDVILSDQLHNAKRHVEVHDHETVTIWLLNILDRQELLVQIADFSRESGSNPVRLLIVVYADGSVEFEKTQQESDDE